MTTHCAPASVSAKVQAAVTGTAASSGCWATWRRAGWRTEPPDAAKPVLSARTVDNHLHNAATSSA
jgi:hypothetical protein